MAARAVGKGAPIDPLATCGKTRKTTRKGRREGGKERRWGGGKEERDERHDY
jgi:hypothetical protein